jgi:proteasome lid subunit RPN8/RPN11
MGRIRGIERSCLSLIQQSARDVYPNEFLALLAVDTDPAVIAELVLLPGMIYGERHAIFKVYMAPVDRSIVGTVHSHPGPSARPSEADLEMFSRYGQVHIITAEPFDDKSWRAYDSGGNPLNLTVVNVE